MLKEREIAWRVLREFTPVLEGNDLLPFINDVALLYPVDREGYSNIERRFAATRFYDNFIGRCRPMEGVYDHWPSYITNILSLPFFAGFARFPRRGMEMIFFEVNSEGDDDFSSIIKPCDFLERMQLAITKIMSFSSMSFSRLAILEKSMVLANTLIGFTMKDIDKWIEGVFRHIDPNFAFTSEEVSYILKTLV